MITNNEHWNKWNNFDYLMGKQAATKFPIVIVNSFFSVQDSYSNLIILIMEEIGHQKTGHQCIIVLPFDIAKQA